MKSIRSGWGVAALLGAALGRDEWWRTVLAGLGFFLSYGLVLVALRTAPAGLVAAVLAQLGRRVAIVDTDLRRPRLHHVFGIDNARGMSTYLSGLEDDATGLARATGAAVVCATHDPLVIEQAERQISLS